MKLYHVSYGDALNSIKKEGLKMVCNDHRINSPVERLLEKHRPEDKPTHRCGVFFFKEKEHAERFMRGEKDVGIIEVDSEDIPCKCVIGSMWTYEKMFEEIFKKTDQSILDRMAQGYWEDVKYIDEGTISNALFPEVWCPCDIRDFKVGV